MRRSAGLAVLGVVFALSAYAFSPIPAPSPEAPLVRVGPAMRRPALALSPALQDDLRAQRWADAAKKLQAIDQGKLIGDEKSSWAFLVAWCLSHAGDAKGASGYLGLLGDAAAGDATASHGPLPTNSGIPAAFVHLVRGEVLRDIGQKTEALAEFAAVDPESGAWPRSAVERAELLRDLGRTSEAFAAYEALASRPDPAPGGELALLTLAARRAPGDEQYALLRRVWTYYPRTPESIEANRLLTANYPSRKPTWQEVGRRGEALMNRGETATAIAELDARAGEVSASDLTEACRYVWVRGRSQFKANKLSASISSFGDWGTKCTSVTPDYGARILYLKGQSQFRTSAFAASAATNQQLAKLYPASDLADDGLKEAGIALQEAADLNGARQVWLSALDLPSGDTVPESAFRLAFALYLQGKPDEARGVAERLGKLPLTKDALHIAAGRYWAARLAMYPDVRNPRQAVADPSRRQVAIDGWRALCDEMPHSFYAILAWSRLKEVAPDVADAVARRNPGEPRADLAKPWSVRTEFYEHPAIREGVALARLGLVKEALVEWNRIDKDKFTGEEMAWLTELRIGAGDWLLAHDDMRSWLKTHPIGTLGEGQPQVIRVAYPDRYWENVQKNAKGYRYEPRLLHALIREESNFNRQIQSAVGARGLSQLMPFTAREVAGWMKTSVTMDQLDDPDTNLKLGARYLDSVHAGVNGSPYLSLAGYNAGPGRVRQWLGEWGNVPTDEYVERIPFKETRGYVKRVMGTWQTERWQFDDGPEFYDLSKYNHMAKPD
jgi:soluble lytic murein transglycosylase